MCESELEFAINGNIRACAYKRDEETQKVRSESKRYKSEERKPTEYFTHDYLQGRYMNDRVEMELEEFKAEISRKFKESLLQTYKYPLIRKQRGSSTEEGVVVANSRISKPE
jgi:hypothetical protein